jgi:hypothetical protein
MDAHGGVRGLGRTVNVRTPIMVDVEADGREVLGLDFASDEDGAGWLTGPTRAPSSTRATAIIEAKPSDAAKHLDPAW